MKNLAKIIFVFSLFVSSFLTVLGLSLSVESTTDDVILWAYENDLTSYSHQKDFYPDKNIKRSEASKFITKFAQNILDEKTIENTECYGFTDIPNKNELRMYMLQSCELGYMKGYKNKFNPEGFLTNQEAVAIIVRTYDGYLEEPAHDRSKNYYNRATELGILKPGDLSNKEEPITRIEFATLLYNSVENSFEEFYFFDTKINYNSGLADDFINNAKTCSPSSITQEIDFDTFGINYYIKVFIEIQGFDGDKCKLYIRLDDMKFKLLPIGGLYNYLNEDDLQEFVEELQDEVSESIGNYGICKYTIGELTEIVEAELLNGFFGEDEDIDTSKCTGPLYDD